MALLQRRTLDLAPVDIRSPENIAAGTIPFINYHPVWIEKNLTKYSFRVINKLSVSNFRSPLFKKMIPLFLALWLERRLQSFLARLNFGPSIFLLAQKEGPT